MNTLRNELKEKYSQIPNELITDQNLCHGSLRVLLYLFTKPDEWNVYNKDIMKQLNISEKTLTKYWKILLSSKWLRREKKQNNNGKFEGGYSYRIGNFTISEQITEQEQITEHSNNKLINKKETNTKPYDSFIQFLKDKAKYKTKVTKTKQGEKLFKQIEDKKQLVKDYLLHQEEKGEYAVRITSYMEDYETVYKQKEKENSKFGEWSE